MSCDTQWSTPTNPVIKLLTLHAYYAVYYESVD